MVSKARLAAHNHDIRRPKSGEWSGNPNDASSPLCFSSRSDHGSLYPRPMTLGRRVSRRVDAGLFCPVHMEASLRISTKLRAPTSLICLLGSRLPDSAIAFNKPFLPRSFGCCEILFDAVSFHKLTEFSLEFTSHVGDQVIHGTCPIYPFHLKYRQNVVWPFGRNWRANFESRGEVYTVQERKHLFV